MDNRLGLLSYSSLNLLHSCPRKFELYRKKANEDEIDPIAYSNQNITFAFGHVVGEGIQRVMKGDCEDVVYFSMFKSWHSDLESRDEKRNKNFWLAMAAVKKFISLKQSGFLNEYELMYYKDKPAIELSFRISFPDGFKFRGSVDAVLKNKLNGQIIVLECKTSSSSTLNPATFKNSSQAIGYSTVLDVICPEINSYKVLYLIYKTKEMEYELLQFPKTYLQRAKWIQELLLDIESIKLYEATDLFPMRGENCFNFFRECEYYNQCTISTNLITVPETNLCADEKIYDVELSLVDLISGQMNKHESIKKQLIEEEITFKSEKDEIL